MITDHYDNHNITYVKCVIIMVTTDRVSLTLVAVPRLGASF